MSKAAMNLRMEAAMENALQQMSEEDREHFKLLCLTLLECYVNNNMHAFILTAHDGPVEEEVQITNCMSINATDLTAAKMMVAARAHVTELLMADAPAQGMFH